MFGVDNLEIKINSLGSGNIRKKYGSDLKKYLMPSKNEFNESELMRLEKNPLRILDSKNKNTQKIVNENAPNIFDYISDEDNQHFNEVTNILDQLKIPYTHDQKLVRGLDYYTKTVFEVIELSEFKVSKKINYKPWLVNTMKWRLEQRMITMVLLMLAIKLHNKKNLIWLFVEKPEK